jgi:multiple sugar transport system permease protein
MTDTPNFADDEVIGDLRLRLKARAINVAIDVFLIAFSLLMLLPLVFLVGNAFKTPQEILLWPPTVIPHAPTLDNFIAVLSETPLLRWIGNSFLFAILSTLSIMATSAIAGYILGKFPSKVLNVVFTVILATAIIPFEVYMIPLYFQVKALGALDSLWGLLVGYLVMSFGIFLIRQNVIHSIPDELLEAARIDGAGEFWVFFYVVLPLLRGPLAALGVLAFFQAWTAFTWPLIVTSTKTSYTIEVGLALFQTGFTVDVGKLSAASSIVLIPSVTLFVFLRRQFVQGVASTGLKD